MKTFMISAGLVVLLMPPYRVIAGCNASDGKKLTVSLVNASTGTSPLETLVGGGMETVKWKCVVVYTDTGAPFAGGNYYWTSSNSARVPVTPDGTDPSVATLGEGTQLSTVMHDTTVSCLFVPPETESTSDCAVSNKVTRFNIDLVYHIPPVVDPNQSELGETTELTQGGVLLINHDNDDGPSISDARWDNEAGEVVTGGDDELSRVDLRLYPHDLNVGQVMFATAAGLLFWEQNTRSGSLANPVPFSPASDFTDMGSYRQKTLFIEGEAPATRYILMDYRNTAGTLRAEDRVKLKIIAVKEVKWQAIDNGDNGSNMLENDPKWPSYLAPTAKRVFPEKHVRVSGSATPVIDATAKRSVKVTVTLTDSPPSTCSPIKCYLRAFDVDDPTADNDDVDKDGPASGATTEDNRGVMAFSSPSADPPTGLRCTLEFGDGDTTKEVEFQPSQQPGDNVRVAATLSPMLFNSVNCVNSDIMQDQGATEAIRNANKQRICEYNTNLPRIIWT